MLDVVPGEDSAASSPFEKSHQVVDTAKELVVSLDLPGVKASDLSITTQGETIHISGARRFTLGGEKAVKKSRFEKSFSVDTQTVDLSQLKANLADGVLVVSAPKKKKPERRFIKITTEPHVEQVEAEPENLILVSGSAEKEASTMSKATEKGEEKSAAKKSNHEQSIKYVFE